MRTKLLAMGLMAGVLVLGEQARGAISVGAFGAQGQGGSKNGQTFSLGAGGSVYELDGFVSVAGQDLNGNLLGTTAQLSRDSLPAGLVYQFGSGLSADQSDVVLTYSFSNSTSNVFSGVHFFVLLDAEIDQTVNTFFNEYGTVQGSPGPGGGDPGPSQWQIDEPGFQGGTLFRNLFLGALNNTNAVPQSALNDVAMGLGFDLGSLQPGDSKNVRVMISEAEHLLGSFGLKQHDASASSTTVITLSGLAGGGTVAQVVGTVFKDANGNGVVDSGEGLSGVSIVLASNQVSVAQGQTDANGKYQINTKPGTYTVSVVAGSLPPGLILAPVTGGATNSPWPVTLVSDFPTTVNWGYRAVPPGIVSGTVFQDANGNGIVDNGEGLVGVRLVLQSNGVSVAQITTSANGNYSFTNVAGNYSVRLDSSTVPAGYTLVAVANGTTVNPANVSLSTGGVSVLNWGFQPPALGAITGTVFRDANTNGIADGGEGLGGVVLQLQSNQVTVAQSTTDTNGKYGFTNAPGNYTLRLDPSQIPFGLKLVGVASGATNSPWSVGITASGVVVVNWGFQRTTDAQFEDVSVVVKLGLSWELNRARGTLVGTLSLTNTAGSGVAVGPPYQLGLKSSADYFYPTNFGQVLLKLPDGVTGLDVSAAVRAGVANGVLNPGSRVTLPQAVEIYSLTRTPPANSQFEIWATRQ